MVRSPSTRAPRDAGVRQPFGHQRDDLALAVGELCEGAGVLACFDTAATPADGRLRPLRERPSREEPLRPTQPIPVNGDKH